ncbi:polyprenyl synthetase family protein [Desulfonema ishimotonii]|uniref:Polyprenyl synthetase family protein n=1 Tax=Desulfonema ishimotonii TaxID=45657 RepID=A0A401G026_9BACT|nr:farnesyl diphosphate synthase [Desulfonema ishimotonii]GBC62579.1 polyprenyl synthetase family protein [Desulfonema ishimotonii]
MRFDLKGYLAERREHVNAALMKILDDEVPRSRIARAMAYSLMAGGKRLRPILCLAAAGAVGGTPDIAMPAACALELVHTYSLIHDDLPALDDDALRRGRPTCHVAFDEATAVLAGDALLTLAFEILASGSGTAGDTARQWLDVIREISTAAGYRGMIEGQMRDIEAEKKALDLAALEQVHARKTGALIEAAVVSGAILGGGGRGQIAALRAYARKIGLAFQVTDDILNVEGDPRVMGKAVGTDADRNKSTYPALLGLEASGAFAETLIEDALTALEGFGERSVPLEAIAAYILRRRR